MRTNAGCENQLREMLSRASDPACQYLEAYKLLFLIPFNVRDPCCNYTIRIIIDLYLLINLQSKIFNQTNRLSVKRRRGSYLVSTNKMSNHLFMSLAGLELE